MSVTHAIVWIDHHSARLMQLDTDPVLSTRIKAHVHYTRQHGSAVRTEHEFFGEVCDALAVAREVLVSGSSTALADFRHYVDKHRPAVAHLIVGWETVNQPTEEQLAAFARKYFKAYDRMTGTAGAG
jgi:hypothetical protein